MGSTPTSNSKQTTNLNIETETNFTERSQDVLKISLPFSSKKSQLIITNEKDGNISNLINIKQDFLFNPCTDINFETRALTQKIRPPASGSLRIPAMISLITKDLILKQKQGIGLDLVCVIDKSASMEGEKLQMVKETLKILINYLSYKDRLSVILFNDSTQTLFKLKKVTEEKKLQMKQKIENIQAEGGTNIAEALYQSFQLLKARKQLNVVTSVFLLSDGQDQESEAVIDEVFLDINFPYTLHSFGYGDDHDSELMAYISQLGNGSFYYVQDLQLLDEFFVDALGALMSVIGQQIQIEIQCEPKAPFNQIYIEKTYGIMWKEIVKSRKYSIKLPLIAAGQRKDFVFELVIPQFNGKLKSKENEIVVIHATFKMLCPITQNFINKECTLKINFMNEIPVKLDQDLDVLAQYYRVRATEVIEFAMQECQVDNYVQAQNALHEMILELQKNQAIIKQISCILGDLKQAYSVSEKLKYKKYGPALMRQMVNNNYNQSGMTASLASDGTQQRSSQTYSTTQSRRMVSELRSSKSTTCRSE